MHVCICCMYIQYDTYIHAYIQVVSVPSLRLYMEVNECGGLEINHCRCK